MKSKGVYKIFCLYIIIIISSNYLFANSNKSAIIILKDGREMIANKIIIINGKGLKFYNDYDLEHFVLYDNIAKIKYNLDSLNCFDRIHLINGNFIDGQIIEEIPETELLVDVLLGGKKIIPFSKIKKIEQIGLLNIDFYSRQYFEFGANLGMPAAINLSMRYWFGGIGVGLSGLHIWLADGLQLDLSFKLSDNEIRSHSVSIVGGFSNIRKMTKRASRELVNFHWDYFGLAYTLNYGGFWLELGLSGGKGNYNTPMPLVQVGFMKRFF